MNVRRSANKWKCLLEAGEAKAPTMGLRSLEVITRSGQNHSRGANAIALSEAHQLLRVGNCRLKAP